jgi:signal transduction histidine kinase
MPYERRRVPINLGREACGRVRKAIAARAAGSSHVGSRPASSRLRALPETPDEPTHMCCFYAVAQDYADLVRSFLEHGLVRGEKCLCVVPAASAAAFRATIRAASPRIEAAAAERIIEVITLERAYSTSKGFLARGALDFWRRARQEAAAHGFSGLRGIVQAGRVPASPNVRARWINYEYCLTQLVRRSGGRMLCLYARALRPWEIVRDVFEAHPAVAHHGNIGKNPFHVPSREWGVQDNARPGTARMFDILEGYWRDQAARQSVPAELPHQADNLAKEALRSARKSQRMIHSLAEDLRRHEHKEQQLRRYVDYLTLGQQLTRTGSWAWNYSSGELFWSREHFRIFGLDPDDTNVSYDLLFQMIHPKERARVKREFHSAVKAKRDFDDEYRIVRPDGFIVRIHSRGRPLFGKRGDLIEYVGTVVDVTERRDGEDSLGRMQAELARTSRAITLGQLMASIAHEVNQPLAALVANANASLRWLQWKEPRIDKARQALVRIVRDGNRASEIIARSRALVRKTDAQRSPVSLNLTVQEVLTFLRTELHRHNVMTQTHLAEPLPPVSADRVQMQQVLLNLVMNAIEAMSSVSSRRRLLTVVTTAEGGDVVVAVKDRGTGFDEHTLERIFEPFYSNKPQGMGIGLAISRSIIDAHGGSLRAARNEGAGATFEFRLPVAGVETR